MISFSKKILNQRRILKLRTRLIKNTSHATDSIRDLCVIQKIGVGRRKNVIRVCKNTDDCRLLAFLARAGPTAAVGGLTCSCTCAARSACVLTCVSQVTRGERVTRVTTKKLEAWSERLIISHFRLRVLRQVVKSLENTVKTTQVRSTEVNINACI